MKKDAVTIAIVVICIAALIYFLWGTISLMQNTNNSGANAVEESAVDESLLEDDGVYKFEDEEADTTDTYDYDLDDEQLGDDYGDEEEIDNSSDEDNFSAQKEEEEEEDNDSEDLGTGAYMVLAGSFSIAENAEKEARRINSFDCCSNAQVTKFNRGAFAVVLVDRFDNVASARNLVEELEDEGVQARVLKKR